MAMAKPVVAVDACGPSEIITSEEDGLLVPADDPAGAMTEAVVRLLTDEQLARNIGDAARKRVERQFSATLLRDEIMNLYRDILQEPST